MAEEEVEQVEDTLAVVAVHAGSQRFLGRGVARVGTEAAPGAGSARCPPAATS